MKPSRLNTASSAITNEIAAPGTAITNKIANSAPEFNYYAFTAATLVVPEFVKPVHQFLGQGGAFLGPLWNYLDALCSGITGVSQLMDGETHRPVTTKIKGTLNILSTAQLTALTVVNQAAMLAPGLLGGPAFAAAFGTAFFISLDESLRCIRRLTEPDYWLKDSEAKFAKLKTSIATLESEIAELGTQKLSSWGKYALSQKEDRLEKLKATRDELKEDIESCTSVYDVEKAVTHRNQKPKLTKEVRQKCLKELYNALANSLCVGVAFAGMLILCIPGAQMAGLVVAVAASTLYLIKHATQLATSKPKPPKEEEKPFLPKPT